MSTWSRVTELPLQIEGYELEGLSRDVSSAFTRRSTVVRLRGGGEEGVGEDVTYDGDDQELLQRAGPVQPLAGRWTLASFSEHLGGLDLFPEPPGMDAARHYRRWAFESAALDLALRQAGRSAAEALGREPAPVRFVVSTRLGDPATAAPLERLAAIDPGARFKLDPTASWSEELVASLAALGRVETVDLKGAYKGTQVDLAPDPVLYERVARGIPGAWIEDPALTPETDGALEPYRERITWDAPIHSWADVEALPFPPRALNVKPSRFGSLRALLELYDRAAERGIHLYGGGQFELGPGRGQIQLLASLFHPDAPNDVAPGGYNDPEPADGLPRTPLPAPPASIGFRWDAHTG